MVEVMHRPVGAPPAHRQGLASRRQAAWRLATGIQDQRWRQKAQRCAAGRGFQAQRLGCPQLLMGAELREWAAGRAYQPRQS